MESVTLALVLKLLSESSLCKPVLLSALFSGLLLRRHGGNEEPIYQSLVVRLCALRARRWKDAKSMIGPPESRTKPTTDDQTPSS